MKKFPRIIDYLEIHHPKLHEILNHLVMGGNLTPRRGGAITFLIPDNAYLKEVEKVMESDDPEKATDMLHSLIITDLFEKPEDFSEKQDDVPTLLGKRLVIKSVTPSKVVIEDGEITPDNKFKPFSRHGAAKRGNMAVWNLKGRVNYEKAPPSTGKYLKKGKMAEKPRKVMGGFDADALRAKRLEIQQAKIMAVSSGQLGPEGKPKCPLLEAVTCILRVWSDPAGPYADEYRSARCLITMCPAIDFYLLFNASSIFPADSVCKALAAGVKVDSNVDFYKDFCSKFVPELVKDEKALLLSDEGVKEARDAVDRVCDKIVRTFNEPKSPSLILDKYKEIDDCNCLDGVGPMYSQKLWNVFHQNPGLHMLIDELCHNIYMALQSIKTEPTAAEKAKDWSDLFQELWSTYGNFSNPTSKVLIHRPNTWAGKIGVEAGMKITSDFMKMWAFHIPCPAPDRIVLGAGETYNPLDRDLYSPFEGAAEELEKLDNAQAFISDSCMAELKAYMKANGGKLPDGLME